MPAGQHRICLIDEIENASHDEGPAGMPSDTQERQIWENQDIDRPHRFAEPATAPTVQQLNGF